MRYVMLPCCLFAATVIGIGVAVLFAEETKKETVKPSVSAPTELVKQWFDVEHRSPTVLVDNAMKYQIEIANPPVGAPTEQVIQRFEAEHRSPTVLADNAMKYQLEIMENFKSRTIEIEDAYFVILQTAAFGEQVLKYPYQGHEKVFDAIMNTNGLVPGNSSKRMWVARQANDKTVILPVDWGAITAQDQQGTNYQLLPGDRVFIAEDGFKPAAKARVSAPTKTAQPQKVWSKETWSKEDLSKKPKPKQIARCVYFEKECYAESLESQCEFLASLIDQQELSVGMLPSKDGKGFYWILFGDEEIVSELHAVFSQIAKGEH